MNEAERGTTGRPERAVVVGSGFGGLSAAIRLQAAGIQTTLVEKRERIGEDKITLFQRHAESLEA